MRGLILLSLGLVAFVVGEPTKLQTSQRIAGGSVTTIDQYPFSAALLFSSDLITYWQSCGGTIITSSAVLTAANCFFNRGSRRWDAPNQWRVRVGSTFANSGGTVLNLRIYTAHPNYDTSYQNNDIAVARTATNIVFSNTISAASIAGTNYNVADNQTVWAIGWGNTVIDGIPSEQLRHVQIWTVNQNTCRANYNELAYTVNDNMLCAGWLDVGGRAQCDGDSGSPLLHNNVVVGVYSWGTVLCALPRYPSVNTRVSRYTAWIVDTAV